MNGLLRQLKLHALVGDKVSNVSDTDPRVGLIVDFFDELFNGMLIEIIPAYHKERVIFHKNSKFYMEQDLESRWLWCRYDDYWSFFEKKIGLEYKDIQVIIHHMVEKHLKTRVGTPCAKEPLIQQIVEKHLRDQVVIPGQIGWQYHQRVEKHLKTGVGTPITNAVLTWSEVENHIKHPS